MEEALAVDLSGDKQTGLSVCCQLEAIGLCMVFKIFLLEYDSDLGQKKQERKHELINLRLMGNCKILCQFEVYLLRGALS